MFSARVKFSIDIALLRDQNSLFLTIGK